MGIFYSKAPLTNESGKQDTSGAGQLNRIQPRQSGMKMIQNSSILLLFMLLLFMPTGCTRTPQNGKTYTVGVVNLNAKHDGVLAGFKKGLAELGYAERQNITYIYNGARSGVTDIESDLKSFVDRKVDLIFSMTTPVTEKAKQMTTGTGIPVVFAPVFDPVGSGIVESLVESGNNLTGIKVGGSSGKALDWLLKIAPDIKTIYVPFNSSTTAAAQSLHDLQQTADKVGVALIVHDVNNREDLEYLLENLPPQADALWLLNSYFLVKHTNLFVAAAVRNRLPIGSGTSQVDGGVLVTYGQDTFRTGKLAAVLAQKIFQGVSPARLPIETTDFFLAINLKTANAIGIDISDDILHVADTIVRP